MAGSLPLSPASRYLEHTSVPLGFDPYSSVIYYHVSRIPYYLKDFFFPLLRINLVCLEQALKMNR